MEHLRTKTVRSFLFRSFKIIFWNKKIEELFLAGYQVFRKKFHLHESKWDQLTWFIQVMNSG